MIGQAGLKIEFAKLIENNKFPRFSIIVGRNGSGKKTICNYIAELFQINKIIVPDCKIDTLRQIIKESYEIKDKTLYIIPDADSMSLDAKNSMLKVFEEPPNNAYFIMTLCNMENTLETIRSRASVFYMEVYAAAELVSYYYSISDSKSNNHDVALICETPYDVELFVKYGEHSFIEFVEKVLDNIEYVSIGNALKIAENISLKKDQDDKYDLRLFLFVFIALCAGRMKGSDEQSIIKYADWIFISNVAVSDINSGKTNLQYIFDKWILDIKVIEDGTVSG